MRRLIPALVLIAFCAPLRAAPDDSATAADARHRWSQSAHGPMLERILPPGIEAGRLPQPESRGARLMSQYCVQCHNLPAPAMHHAAKWPAILDRMVVRMQGKGNMGALMRDMMAGVSVPTPDEVGLLAAYLRRNAMLPLDPKKYPDINRPQAQSFRLACQQCHVLPDPQRYTARQWPAVVARMEKNMAWMNRVVGTRNDPTEPQLRVDEIIAFLSRHAKPE
jgi:cytochrome c5